MSDLDAGGGVMPLTRPEETAQLAPFGDEGGSFRIHKKVLCAIDLRISERRSATTANADGLSFAGIALAAASITAERSRSSSRLVIRSISRPMVSPDFRRNRFVDQIR
jgi:hypothetical protein